MKRQASVKNHQMRWVSELKFDSQTYHESDDAHVLQLLKAIEGETRVLAASMIMDEISKGTKDFMKEVFEKVKRKLNKFRLWIYNANIKQLVDVHRHEYFSYLGQKV